MGWRAVSSKGTGTADFVKHYALQPTDSVEGGQTRAQRPYGDVVNMTLSAVVRGCLIRLVSGPVGHHAAFIKILNISERLTIILIMGVHQSALFCLFSYLLLSAVFCYSLIEATYNGFNHLIPLIWDWNQEYLLREPLNKFRGFAAQGCAAIFQRQ